MDAAFARELLLAMPNVTEHAHFDKQAFRGTTSKGKPSKFFLTLWVEENRAVLLLDQGSQAALHEQYPVIFFPVPNKWGDKGATFVELARCSERQFLHGLSKAMRLAGCA